MTSAFSFSADKLSETPLFRLVATEREIFVTYHSHYTRQKEHVASMVFSWRLQGIPPRGLANARRHLSF